MNEQPTIAGSSWLFHDGKRDWAFKRVWNLRYVFQMLWHNEWGRPVHLLAVMIPIPACYAKPHNLVDRVCCPLLQKCHNLASQQLIMFLSILFCKGMLLEIGTAQHSPQEDLGSNIAATAYQHDLLTSTCCGTRNASSVNNGSVIRN